MSEKFIKMGLYHGRKDPDEDMDGWGFSGPRLIQIASVHYQAGRIFLSCCGDDAMHGIIGMTGWKARDGRLFVWEEEDASENDLKYLEFIGCLDKNGETDYYSDFEIEAVDQDLNDMPSELHLMDCCSFHDQEALVISHVHYIRFTYGSFQVWFNSLEDCRQAQRLTGWRAGLDGDLSLEMGMSSLGGRIMTGTNGLTDSVLFRQFVLKPM